MIPSQALRDWQNFYLLTGTAAATLVGLLFIAVSISAGIDLSGRQAADALRTFVTPILMYYFQVLLVSCIALIPLQSSLLLSGVLVILGSINIALTLKVFWRMLVLHREVMDLLHWLWHGLLPLIAGILFAGTALGFLWGGSLALAGLSIVNLLCLAIGLRNSWALTTWLILHPRQEIGVSQEKQAL